MPTRESIRTPPLPVDRESAEVRAQVRSTASTSLLAEILPPERPWSDVLFEKFQGDEGAGFAISLVLHLILLALLAIPIIQLQQNEEGFTTILENSTNEEQVVFDAPLDTLVAMPEAASVEDQFLQQLLDSISPNSARVPEMEFDKTTLKGENVGTGSGGEFGGGRIAEPENAIKAGNFSVWPWPIEAGKINGEEQRGKPGDFPRVRQPYFITIRIKTPPEKLFARLSDFSGRVVGTDGYTQVIPDDAYYFRGSGELVKARPTHRIPVIEGTVELLIRVPGASFAEVRDKITVYSRILDEEQEIELVFRARSQ